MADHPLRPATDRSLGGPLPRQPANRTQAPRTAAFAFGPWSHPKAPCGISRSFPRLSPTPRQVPTRSSPVRHWWAETHPCDLHVLGMPPAFALSQDQTLRFIKPAPPRPGTNARRRPNQTTTRRERRTHPKARGVSNQGTPRHPNHTNDARNTERRQGHGTPPTYPFQIMTDAIVRELGHRGHPNRGTTERPVRPPSVSAI